MILLVLHLPLTGDIHNQGLLKEEIYKEQNLSYSGEGKLGKCLQFNGDPKQILSFVNVPKKKNNFTWACWIKQTNRTSTVYQKTIQYVLSMGRDCGAIGFNIRMINGYLNIHLGSGEDTDATTSTTNKNINIQELQLNIWYHICCTVDNENVNVYINGELVKTFPLVEISYRSNFHGYFTVGKMGYNNNNTSAFFPFDGLIQDIRVYDTAISPRQVKEISKGLVCHYPLGEVDGKIGGRNLIKNSKGNVKAGFFKNINTDSGEYGEFTLKSKKTYGGLSLDGFVYRCREYTVGEKYTWSYDIMYTAWNFPTGSNRAEFWMGQRYVNAPSGETSIGAWRGVTQHNLPVVGQNGCELNKWYHVEKTITIPEQASSNIGEQWLLSFYNSNADVEASFTARIKNVKLEKSSTATPWTPALEDDAFFYDNVIYDTSGYCNNGSVSGDILWDTNTPRYKGAYDFNGTGYIKNDNFGVYFKEFTISYWIKVPESISSQHFAWGTFNNFTGNGVGSWRDVDSTNRGYSTILRSNTENNYGWFTRVPLLNYTNTWVFLSFIYTGITLKTYVNGKLYGNIVTYGSNGSVYMPVVYLGNSLFNNSPSSETDECSMVDFRIYASALSDSDVLELYQSSALVDNSGNLMLAGEVIEE